MGVTFGSRGGYKRRRDSQETIHFSRGSENGTTVFVSTARPLHRLSGPLTPRNASPFLSLSPNRDRRMQRVWFGPERRWHCARKASPQSEFQCTGVVWQSATRHTFDEVDHGSARVPLIRHAAQKFVIHPHHFASPALSVIDRGVSCRRKYSLRSKF